MPLMAKDHFLARVRVYRALDTIQERGDWVLTQIRGLGLESPMIKWAALGTVAIGLGKHLVSPRGRAAKISRVTALFAFSVWPDVYASTSEGWLRLGSVWAWVGRDPAAPSRPDPANVYLREGCTEADLWAELREAFAAKYPAAQLSEQRDGYVAVTADRPTNVRRLTPREEGLARRLRGYVDAGVSTSVLLYGPQGSAKTTAACSVADAIAGSYFRLAASNIGREEIRTLVDLRPRVVILDDIDRVGDVSLLEMLDAMTAAGVVVFATSNTAPDARHGDTELMDAALVRSGRFDIHIRVDQLDPESHAQICRDNGLGGVDLGPRSSELLSSDLVALGRMHAAHDLSDPPAAAEDLLLRRTNTMRRLRVQPSLTMTKAESS